MAGAKVAIVHDWLTGMRGGEAVLEAIVELFPRAELFTLLHVPGAVSSRLSALKMHSSWLQKVPRAKDKYRHFLPLMPQMIEQFDLKGFDLILSSSHCVAKGVRKPPGSVHLSYVHAPMRYIWDRYDDYFGPGRASLPVRFAAKSIRKYLQNWDRRVSQESRVDTLLANSQFIAAQIKKAYGRDSQVLYPFAELDRFRASRAGGRNYLMVTAFAPYKRVDVAIEAFNRLKLPLIIVGSGQDEVQLRKMAGPTIEFFGSLSNAAVADMYSKCKALIFPGVEDFGITPVEAMAAGMPVIALKEGGVSETVTAETGVLYELDTSFGKASFEEMVTALMSAVLKVERGSVQFDEAGCRRRAAQFSRDRFQSQFLAAVRQTWTRAGKDERVLSLFSDRF